MIDVVRLLMPTIYLDHHAQQVNNIVGREDALLQVRVQAQAPVELVASYRAQVVPPGIEEKVLQKVLGVLGAG